MPVMLKFGCLLAEVPVATEQELLDFANKLRAAGAADPLEALMPSKPSDPDECLIANACNFGCSVNGSGFLAGSNFNEIQWSLYFPKNMDEERAERIATAVDCKLRIDLFGSMWLDLPREIGNAAHAFDNAVDWTAKFYRIPNMTPEV